MVAERIVTTWAAGIAREGERVNRVVVAIGAVVVFGGLVAAARRPTRTPRPSRRLPTATPRLMVIRGPQPPGATRGAGAAVSARTRRGRVRAHERHGVAAWPRGKRATAGGFIIASSPLLRVVASEPLASGSGRDVASRWFVQIANLDTRAHVASATAVCAVTQ